MGKYPNILKLIYLNSSLTCSTMLTREGLTYNRHISLKLMPCLYIYYSFIFCILKTPTKTGKDLGGPNEHQDLNLNLLHYL